MKHTKKILAAVLAVIMVLSAAPLGGFADLDLGFRASALASSGSCGTNVTYTYDSSTGELVISGTGAMANYGSSPFYSSDIKFVIIEDGVTSIGPYAFYYCTSLASVTIPDSVTSIGDRAFLCCTSLESVTIPDSVTSIGNSAFSDCTSLASVTIGDSVTSIGSSAFDNCASLASVTIPDSVTSIGNNAFYNTGYYKNSSNWEDDVLYIGKYLIDTKTSLSGSYTIKDGTKVIANSAFSNCTSLASITIPDSVTSIGSNTFSGCSSLETLTIGKGIKEIPANYFANFTALKTVNLSEGLEKIGDGAFSGCSYLEAINIPQSVTYIGVDILKNTAWFNYRGKGLIVFDGWAYGFKGSDENVTVTFDETVKAVADEAFKDRNNIVAFEVSSDNPYLSSENGVLFNKDKTELIAYPCGKSGSEYTVPDTVNIIRSDAFYNCNSLYSITIPESVKSIGASAFYNNKIFSTRRVYMTDLEAWCKIDFADTSANPLNNNNGNAYLYINGVSASDIVIPDTITEIKAYAFYNCRSLRDVTIGDSVTTIGDSAFGYCRSLTSVTIPDSVTSIGSVAFYNCGSLRDVTIPDSVTTIGSDAFRYCDRLTSVTLGKSLESIGYDAFNGCSSLKDVYYPGSQEDWEKVSIGSYNEPLTNANLYLMHKHEYTITVTKAPTCTEKGELLYTCVHGDTKTEEIPALGHTWSEWATVAPDCNTYEKGYDIRTCSDCGAIEKSNYVNYEHSYITEKLPGTMDSSGYTRKVCSACGYVYSETYIPYIRSVSLSSSSEVYDGNIKTPEVIAKNSYGQRILTKYYDVEYIDGDMLNPGVYKVKVTFKGKYGGEVLLDYIIKPAKPEEFTANGRYVSVDLNWSDVAGADAYVVYRYSSGAFREVETVTQSNYRVTDLNPGTSYRFAVKAVKNLTGDEKLYSARTDLYAETVSVPMCDHIDENSDRICDICQEETLMFAGKRNSYSYKLYDDGTLIISGSGTAYCRWQNYREFIKRVIVEEGITALGSGCLAMCCNMKEITLPLTLVAIYDEAFYSCESLEAIDIPDSVDSLGQSLFSGCISLEALDIPEGITELNYYFASGCTALKRIGLPSTITELGEGAFAYCSALENVDLPEGLKRIKGAFKFCSSLKEIDLPEGIDELSSGAFVECDSLTEIDFPENLNKIGYNAFGGCDGLEELTIESNISYIDDSAFYGCSGLKKITVASETIECCAFSNCENLEEVELIKGVRFIGCSAFDNCGKLSKIIFCDGLEMIDDAAFYNCMSLKSVTLPESINFIGSQAFYRCHNLSDVDLGGTKHIRYSAFEDCIRLTEIVLPDTVSLVRSNAFKNCIRLSKITFENSDCQIDSYIDTIPEKAVIYGYEDSTAQKYADDWLRDFVSLSGEHRHRYAEEITTAPTCTQAGVKTFTCSCGDSYTETIAATGHTEAELKAVEPTCTEDGLTKGSICSVCEEILLEQETLPATGHAYEEDVDLGTATSCTEDGTRVFVCANCGDSYEEAIAATGHLMDESQELSVAPTCTSKGKKVSVCANCDYKQETELDIDKNAHSFEWTETKAPDCTQKGERQGKCSLCTESKIEEIPALGHAIAEEDWIVVHEANCISTGDKVALCPECGTSVRKLIPLTDHVDSDGDNKCDVCSKDLSAGTEQEPTQPQEPDTPDTPTEPEAPDTPAAQCDCNCHKTGFAKIIFNIVLFFQKLFGQNQTCACGVAHY